MTTDLGLLIRTACKQHGMSLTRLADEVDRDTGTVSRWANNKGRPSGDAVQLLIEALGLEPDEVYRALAEPIAPVATDVVSAIKADERLSAEARRHLIGIYNLLTRDQHEVALDDRLGEQVEHEEAVNDASEDTPDRPTLCLG